MTDAPMKIEARFDAALLDELRRDNARLREALKECRATFRIMATIYGGLSPAATATLEKVNSLLAKLSDLAPTETHGKP